jgi:hypothetical protein
VIVTLYGLVAVGFMMAMYTLEHVDRRFVLAFAFGCLLSSSYGFLSGAWPFGIVEAIWAMIALRRYRTQTQPAAPALSRLVLAEGAAPPDAASRPGLSTDRPQAADRDGQIGPCLRMWSSVNPSRVGEPVTFTAQLRPRAGDGAGRTVTFGVGLSALGTVGVDDAGITAITTTLLPAGRHLVIVTTDREGVSAPHTAWLIHVVDGRAGAAPPEHDGQV